MKADNDTRRECKFAVYGDIPAAKDEKEADGLNKSYRSADHERWKSEYFVIGIEIRLSNNHTCNGEPFFDICDMLKGKYPKTFKFTGWHPMCRCYAVPILCTCEELLDYMKKKRSGEDVSNYKFKGEVKELPEGMKKWIEENGTLLRELKEKKELPNWITENSKYIKIGDMSDSINYARIESVLFEYPRRKQIYEESLRIIQKTNNLETFLSRIKDVNDYIGWLSDNFDTPLLSQYIQLNIDGESVSTEEFFKEFQAMLNDNILRIALANDESIKMEISRLKQQKSKESRIIKLYGFIEKASNSLFDAQNKEEIEDKLNSMRLDVDEYCNQIKIKPEKCQLQQTVKNANIEKYL